MESEILDYWFEGIGDETSIDKKKSPFNKWFAKSARIDQKIRMRFEPVLIQAKRGDLRSLEKTARGRLALVILYDQFSRNIYRDTPRMYASDPQAIELTLRSIEDQMDRQLQCIERVFLYTPLMHAEDRQLQALALKHFQDLTKMIAQRYPFNAAYYQYTFGFVKNYYDIILRFGRFPHRNRILKRTSSSQELEFLAGR